MAMRCALSRASVNRLAESARGATRSLNGGKWSTQDMEREREERRKHEADKKKAEQDGEAAGRLNLFVTLSNLERSSNCKLTKKADGSEAVAQ